MSEESSKHAGSDGAGVISSAMQAILRNHEWVPECLLKNRPAFSQSAETAPIFNRITSEALAFASLLHFEAEPHELKQLCSDYIVNAFVRLGWNPTPASRLTPESFAATLGIVASQKRQMIRFLEILQEDGIVRKFGVEWEVQRIPAPGDMKTRLAEAAGKYPGWGAELGLLKLCGDSLAAVLGGRIKPADLVFNGAGMSAAEFLYSDSPTLRNFNLLQQLTAYRLASQMPRLDKMRILEIGGGTGGLANHVLSSLRGCDVEYTFTDRQRVFLDRAGQKLAGYGFVSIRPLDIERNTHDQGFEDHSFDLILASESIHVTADLRGTLRNIKLLLAPGGILLMTEMIRPNRWSDLVMGLLDDWWRFSGTDSRQAHPSASLLAWRALLAELGFVDITTFAPVDERSAPVGNALLMASTLKSGEPTSRPAVIAPPQWNKPGAWLIFDNTARHGAHLAELLTRTGERCLFVTAGRSFRQLDENHCEMAPGSADDMKALAGAVEAWRSEALFRGFVHMWSMDLPRPESMKLADIDGVLNTTGMSVRNAVHEFTADKEGEPPRMFIVTRGSQSTGHMPEPCSLIQAALWGLGRMSAREHPDSRCTLVDLAGGAPDPGKEAFALMMELATLKPESEIALRGDTRYVRRLAETTFLEARPAGMALREKEKHEDGFRLELDTPGGLSGPQIRRFPRHVPDADEVEIEVNAAGLNSNDIIRALDSHPARSTGTASIGIECAGTITRVGRNVRSLQPGHRVIAMASPACGSHVTTRQEFVMPLPGKLSFTEAATIPVAFLTAYHSLIHEARLQIGERLLVYAPDCDIALAAIQIARRVGAEAIIAADSSEGEAFLENMGVKRILDTRHSDFTARVMDLTGNEGVDVVFDPRSEAGTAGAVMRKNGRFIVLGKQDRPGVKAVDIGECFREDPGIAASHLKAIHEGFIRGSFNALPFRAITLAMAHEAFRCLAGPSHFEKTVLTIRDHIVQTHPCRSTPTAFKPGASYLLTGGFGNLGMAIAEWMAAHGAKHIALMGRSGATKEETRKRINAMEGKGIRILQVRGDVARDLDVRRALSDIRQSMPPLRGIVHAATVTASGAACGMMEPKAKGAWNMHVQTALSPMDFFLLLSCTASSQYQSDIAASTSFIEALSFYRRSKGLSCNAVSWSRIACSETTAHEDSNELDLDWTSGRSLSLTQALEALSKVLANNPVQIEATCQDQTAPAERTSIVPEAKPAPKPRARKSKAGGRTRKRT